jgi:hypothetical protein
MRLLKQFSSRLQLSPEPFEAAPSEQPQQAARHQPPVLSVPYGAGRRPAGCIQCWPAASAAGAAGGGPSGTGRRGQGAGRHRRGYAREKWLCISYTPRLARRLEHLGSRVSLEPVAMPAA